MKTCFLALLIFGMGPTSYAAVKTLSLSDAVGFALENSPVFDTAKKSQAVRELEYKSSIAKMLPSVDASATNGLQNNVPIASATDTHAIVTSNPAAPWYSSLNLGLTESLYDNGVSLTNSAVAQLNREAVALNLLKIRDTLVFDVTAAFYRFSLVTALLDVRKQQQSILEKQFKNLTDQYEQGLKTKSDYLRLKTQVQRADIDRLNAENNIALSITELHKFLGVGIESTELPSFEPVAIVRGTLPKSKGTGGLLKIENFYDYKIKKIQDEINGKGVMLAKRNYWPQVSVSSGISYSNQNFLNSNSPFNSGQRLSWNALLSLQYNLWDWGTRRRNVMIAEFNRDIQENLQNQSLLEVHSRLTALNTDLKRTERSFQLSQDLLVLEEESNGNLQSQYREGRVSFLDLMGGLEGLLDARVQYYTSYFDFLQNIARHRYYEGKIYESVASK